jgi:AcrR family transcriptional regulator
MERRRPGPEPRFTREQLARRALAIMDAHGSEALTMRRLAEELGMGTMALYRYFPIAGWASIRPTASRCVNKEADS